MFLLYGGSTTGRKIIGGWNTSVWSKVVGQAKVEGNRLVSEPSPSLVFHGARDIHLISTQPSGFFVYRFVYAFLESKDRPSASLERARECAEAPRHCCSRDELEEML